MQSTAWYGLYNGNISVVYSPSSHVSTYLTYNKAQYVLPTANDGAVATFGEASDQPVAPGHDPAEEAGVKFDLLDKRLFISSAIFNQDARDDHRRWQLANTMAHIKGAEIELNYQPDPHFFATASYSYLHTTSIRRQRRSTTFPRNRGSIMTAPATLRHVFPPNQTLPGPGRAAAPVQRARELQASTPASVLRRTFRSPDRSTSAQSGYLNIAATNANAAG